MNSKETFRYLIVLSLISILGWFVYNSIVKLLKQDTVISQHYQKGGANLPSITVCIKWLSKDVPNTKEYFRGLSLPDSENWTFDDYMEKSFDIRNVLHAATFKDQPSDKSSL